MKLGTCKASNFGSYEQLEFDFSAHGLTLVQGSTGSGKSTLFDLPCWILYGVTAKGGSVDDVRTWDTKTTTTGSIEATTKDGKIIKVTRIRGNANQNDLFYIKDDIKVRGLNAKDTQKLLNEELGVDHRLYSYASYFSEFSPSSIFFNTIPKNRKYLLDSLTDLSLINKVEEASKSTLKLTKTSHEKITIRITALLNKLEHTQDSITNTESDSDAWNNRQEALIDNLNKQSLLFEEQKQLKVSKLQEKAESFEVQRNGTMSSLQKEWTQLRNKIHGLHSDPCETCGRKDPESEEHKQLTAMIKVYENDMQVQFHKINPYVSALEQAIQEVNHVPKIISMEKAKLNPYLDRTQKLKESYEELASGYDVEQSISSASQLEIEELELLIKICLDAKEALLQNSVENLQTLTNHFLSSYFDGEFTVSFSLDGPDDLNVYINKNGSECNYTQLSKGQRGLLKLSFATSVMVASANNAGIDFRSVFLDESLDGLDTNLKIKAIGMLQELATQYDNVFVIDHSTELKASIDNVISVRLNDGRSELEL